MAFVIKLINCGVIITVYPLPLKMQDSLGTKSDLDKALVAENDYNLIGAPQIKIAQKF